MNALQEAILDRLIGADAQAFADNHGPVGLALGALVEAGLLEPGSPLQALGYPLQLTKALHAAAAMLATVEEQRQLALTLFAEVPPRSPAPCPPGRVQVEAALWCADRVHPLVCRAACPALAAARKHLDLFWAGDPLQEVPLELSQATWASCQASKRVIWDAVNGSAITLRSLSYRCIQSPLAGAQALRQQQPPDDYTCVGAANAARLAAHFLGLDGAADFCRALARELGHGAPDDTVG